MGYVDLSQKWRQGLGLVIFSITLGAYKSADVRIFDFAAGRKGIGFGVFVPGNIVDHSCS